MTIKIPPHHVKAFGDLLGQSGSDWSALLEVLQNLEPKAPLALYATSVEKQLGKEPGIVAGLVQILSSFLSLREHFPGSFDELMRELREAAEHEQLETTEDTWNRFEKNLKRFFAANTSLETVAKARDIAYEEQRILYDVRVISDLRPVFRREIEKAPQAFIVSHTLRISYYENEQNKEVYFALDRNDLKRMQTIATRALEKEDVLVALAKSLKVPYLGELDVGER